MGRHPNATQAPAAPEKQDKGPEQQAPAAPEKPRRWRARMLCYDGTLYQPGAERTSMADLDPAVWEEL